jgi:S1-C subfamily serine protease
MNGVGSLGNYAGSPARLSLSVPTGSFGKAGLADGDFIRTVNGTAIRTPADFNAIFSGAKVGDVFAVEYVRAAIPHRTTVTILPYKHMSVTIVDLPIVSGRQRMVRDAWIHGRR